MVVQHNLRAMNANRMLNITTNAQAKSAEKLSSGYKINRAADDAAGLSISEKMRKQIRGLSQASNNAEDGISTVQTAEGALQEVQDMLQRMNELAVQSANGTNSSTDRASIQDEIDQLVTEIDRVAETTKFNETYLLKGDDTKTATDYAYKGSTDVTSQKLFYLDSGEIKEVAEGTLVEGLDANQVYYTSDAKAAVGEAMTSANSSDYVESKVVAKSGYYEKLNDGSFVAVEAGTALDSTKSYYQITDGANGSLDSATSVASSDTGLASTATVVKSGKVVYDSTGKELTAGDVVDTTKAYTSKAEEVLDTAKTITLATATTQKAVQLTDKNGNEIAQNGLYKYFDDDEKYIGGLYLNGKEITDPNVIDAAIEKDDSKVAALTMKFHVGADATSNNQISVDIEAMSAKNLGVKGLKVDGEDDTNALNAVETISAALGRISEQRSALGAVQNRLEHTIKNLDNIVENTTSAESQIRDTDMATEMVAYSNNNILAQAGQSMLAQANQGNQGVLSLLG